MRSVKKSHSILFLGWNDPNKLALSQNPVLFHILLATVVKLNQHPELASLTKFERLSVAISR